jgi:hypothetical protein
VHRVADVLCGIARAADTLDPYLAAWADDRRPTATRHLVDLLNEDWSPIDARPRNEHWAHRHEQRAQLARWLATTSSIHERLADAATAPDDEPNATEAGWALARLPGTRDAGG